MKIISGGQSGVDRAALDFCLENNIPCGGWCPKGRLAEDGPIPEKYPLIETLGTNYAERTRLNVENSDGTLIIYCDKMDEGSLLTMNLIETKKKPYFSIDISLNVDPVIVRNWLFDNAILTVNVAGPRESNCPGIYQQSKEILSKILQ